MGEFLKFQNLCYNKVNDDIFMEGLYTMLQLFLLTIENPDDRLVFEEIYHKYKDVASFFCIILVGLQELILCFFYICLFYY